MLRARRAPGRSAVAIAIAASVSAVTAAGAVAACAGDEFRPTGDVDGSAGEGGGGDGGAADGAPGDAPSTDDASCTADASPSACGAILFADVVLDDFLVVNDTVVWTGPNGIFVQPANAGIDRRSVLTGEPGVHLATDGTTLFWTTHTGVHACPLTGCATPTVISDVEEGPADLAADSDGVYWSDLYADGGGALIADAPQGGARLELVNGETYPRYVASDPTRLYWFDSCEIRSHAKNAAGPTVPLGTGACASSGLFVDRAGGALFGSAGAPPSLFEVPLATAGGGLRVDLDAGTPSAIAADEARVYWLTLDGAQPSGLWTIPRTSFTTPGAAQRIAPGDGGRIVRVTATEVWWDGDAKNIWRRAK